MKIVSWNLQWDTTDPARRMTSALDHLQELFGTAPDSLVVMVQEIRLESLNALLENSWVQRDFNLTDSTPPCSIYDYVQGDSFVQETVLEGNTLLHPDNVTKITQDTRLFPRALRYPHGKRRTVC
jgi:hypothetical protein